MSDHTTEPDIELLVLTLRHRHPNRRAAAAMQLLRLGLDAVKPVTRSLDLVDHGRDASAIAVIARLGEAAAVPLAEMLVSGTRDERRKAARALRALGSEALPALGALLEALADPEQDSGVMLRLLGVLRQLGAEVADRTVPVLIELLSDETWSTWAADLLGLLGRYAIGAESALLDLAAVGGEAERKAARRALARIAPRALSGLRSRQEHAREAEGPAEPTSGSGPRWERIRFPGWSLAFSLPDPGCSSDAVECVLSDRSGRVIAMGRMVADASLQFGAVREIGAEFRAVPLDVDRMVVVMVRARLGLGRPDETSLSWISELPIFAEATPRR